MWFKREQKNRRLRRGHVLDVKLRSDQVRATRARLASRSRCASCSALCSASICFWRAGEWALDKFVYENSTFAIQDSGSADRRRDCAGTIAPLGGREAGRET